jgi:hypothetical protein
MSDPWYYSRGNERQGPVPLSTLQQWAVEGHILPSDYVWRPGDQQWIAARDVRELFDAQGEGVNAPPDAPPAPVPPPLPPVTHMPQSRSVADDPGMRMILPVGRSPWAIVAGYLGLLSLAILPAPIALVVSIFAVADLRRHPEKRGMGRAVFGLVMGVMGTAVLVGAAVLAQLAR